MAHDDSRAFGDAEASSDADADADVGAVTTRMSSGDAPSAPLEDDTLRRGEAAPLPSTVEGTLQAGDLIAGGRYEVGDLLGAGGMGAVFRGEDCETNRPVAIKLLHPALTTDRTHLRRFEREAKAAARIRSPHIAKVFEVDQLPSGVPFFVMEGFAGESLSARLKAKGRVSPMAICGIGIQLLRGLQAAHDAGIIHRDLKPGNVFLAQQDGREVVKLLDFGISKFVMLDETNLTKSGMLLGTPAYMAPEQGKGTKHVDERADIYSVGALLFRAVAGRPPHEGRHLMEQITKLFTEDIPPLQSVCDVDDDFAELVHVALQRNPDDRYASAEEFRRALEAWRDGYVEEEDEPTARAARPPLARRAGAATTAGSQETPPAMVRDTSPKQASEARESSDDHEPPADAGTAQPRRAEAADADTTGPHTTGASIARSSILDDDFEWPTMRVEQPKAARDRPFRRIAAAIAVLGAVATAVTLVGMRQAPVAQSPGTKATPETRVPQAELEQLEPDGDWRVDPPPAPTAATAASAGPAHAVPTTRAKPRPEIAPLDTGALWPPPTEPDAPPPRGSERFDMNQNKEQLVRKMRTGRATQRELRALKAICMAQGDRPCRDAAVTALGKKRTPPPRTSPAPPATKKPSTPPPPAPPAAEDNPFGL